MRRSGTVATNGSPLEGKLTLSNEHFEKNVDLSLSKNPHKCVGMNGLNFRSVPTISSMRERERERDRHRKERKK